MLFQDVFPLIIDWIEESPIQQRAPDYLFILLLFLLMDLLAKENCGLSYMDLNRTVTTASPL